MKLDNSFFSTLRNYLTVYFPMQKCCSEKTIKAYREVLNYLMDYLRDVKGISFQKVSFNLFSEKLVLDFLDWLQITRHYSASTRNQRLMALRSFFRYAGMVDCAQIDIHMQLRKIPLQNGPGKVIEYLSEDALSVLLDQPDISKATDHRNHVFMVLMYDAAARCSELLDARVRDLRLDPVHPTIYLTGKGDKTRTVPIMDQNLNHYRYYLERFHPPKTRDGTDYLFFTVSHGQRHRMSPDNVAYFMKQYGEKARQVCPNIPARVHPHQLRHTRAIHLYRDGMPMQLVSEFLGHASVETTKIYAYADTEMKREAIRKGDRARGIMSDVEPVWKNDEEMMRKLCGLR